MHSQSARQPNGCNHIITLIHMLLKWIKNKNTLQHKNKFFVIPRAAVNEIAWENISQSDWDGKTNHENQLSSLLYVSEPS